MSISDINTAYSENTTKFPVILDIKKCNILGVEIAAINKNWLVDFICDNISKLSGKYICVSNVHTTVMSYEDSAYRLIQKDGIMAIPDGGPLALIGKLRGYNNMDRTTGPDIMEEIFKVSVSNGFSHYFYGSTEETLMKLRVKLESKYPGIKIIGMHSPPFRELTKTEDNIITKHINEHNPNFIWVGLGAPKQEIWMSQHKDRVKGLMLGVGAGFDYHAGIIKRAPIWMQKSNLEWSYRLIQDPKRLLKRYMVYNLKFILYLLKELLTNYNKSNKGKRQ